MPNFLTINILYIFSLREKVSTHSLILYLTFLNSANNQIKLNKSSPKHLNFVHIWHFLQ